VVEVVSHSLLEGLDMMVFGADNQNDQDFEVLFGHTM